MAHSRMKALGPPTVLQAHLLGSAARRDTAIWTNMADLHTAWARQTTRSSNTQRPPIQKMLTKWGAANWSAPDPDQQLLPKFVSRHASYAFRENSGGPGSGMLLHHGRLEEPSAFIRECAMGFAPNSTAAPGASESLRRRALGAAIDMNIATWVIRTALQQASNAEDA